jgi:methylmalonyl-CoA/ethylmalonyl-CoA epimerase
MPSLAVDLDHVAHAVERPVHAWRRYAGELGGTWQGGNDDGGFAFGQVVFANGMKVEAISPLPDQPGSDFLARFLASTGEGPHHITFKVPDFDEALGAASAFGIEPVGVNRDEDDWHEAFLHPKRAHGIVVQLAWSAPHDEWTSDPPADFPADLPTPPAALDRAVHLVADLDGAVALFSGLLGGRLVSEDPGRCELAWPGPGRLCLVRPSAGTPEAAWLGDRPGRLHHLAFTAPGAGRAARVAGAVGRGDGTYEVPPEANHGVRLVLRG